MTSLQQQWRSLWVAVLTLMVLIPHIHAEQNGATLLFSSDSGVTPVVRSLTSELIPGQPFVTGSSEIRDILFPDGSALMLGVKSKVVLDDYAYNSETHSGKMTLRIEYGLLRLDGGKMNATAPFVIHTPTAVLRLENGSAFVEVGEDGRTRTTLLYGQKLTMSSGGKSKKLVRPGFELVATSTSTPPQGPSRQSQDAMATMLAALSTGQVSTQASADTETSADTPQGENATLGSGIFALTTEDQPSGMFTLPERPAPIGGALKGSGGLGAGIALEGPKTEPDQPTQANGDIILLTQNQSDVAEDTPITRAKGKTTNRLFNSSIPLTQAVTGDKDKDPHSVPDNADGITPTPVPDDTNLQYIFFRDGGLSIAIDRVEASKGLSIGSEIDITAPFLLRNIQLPLDGEILIGNIKTIIKDDLEGGSGSIFKDATHYKILQSGFSLQETDNFALEVKRKIDNFFLAEVSPGKVIKRSRDDLRGQFSINNIGEVNDPVNFNSLIGEPISEFDLSMNDQDAISNINMIARIVLGDPNLEDATPLGKSELQELAFLSEDDKRVILSEVNEVLESEHDPSRTERFLFATGDVDSRLDPNFKKIFSVDRFFISDGLENFDQKDEGKTITDGIRAFLRQETGLNLDLVDTGLLVVNTGSLRADAHDALLHSDFGLNGTGGSQQSTLSVTIGQVEYRIVTCSDCNIQRSVEPVVTGQTIGSSRGTIVTVNRDGSQTTTDEATVAVSSPLMNTAAGGRNPNLRNDDGTPRKGYAGYFVLENFDPERQGDPIGGMERPMGQPENAQEYAYLRLATATGSSTSGEVQVGQRSALSLQGWAAGLAELQSSDGIGVTQIDTDETPANVIIRTDPDTNRVEAQLTLVDHMTLQLGGLKGASTKGASAFVDDDLFAARTMEGDRAEVVMITGEVLKDGLPQAMQAPIRDYQHVKWGYFFGDTLITPGQREHVHLGSWMAGKSPNPDDLPLTGIATYTGHAMGNVFNNGSLYTAVGSVQKEWNFGSRSGTMHMQFDGTMYNGPTRLRDNSAIFEGRLDAANRVGGVRGNFVQGGSDPAAGVIGRFSIQEAPGASAYRASGTFAAEK